MAVLAVDDLWDVEFWCERRGIYSLNRHRFLVVGTVGAVGVTDLELAEWMANNFFPLYQLVLSESAATYGVRAYRSFPTGTSAADYPLVLQGTTTGNDVPPQVAGFIRFRNGALGRKNFGRTYIPFLSAASVAAEGVATNLYRNRLGFIGADLLSPTVVNASGDAAQLKKVTRSTPVEDYRVLTVRTAISTLATSRSRSYMNGIDTPPF